VHPKIDSITYRATAVQVIGFVLYLCGIWFVVPVVVGVTVGAATGQEWPIVAAAVAASFGILMIIIKSLITPMVRVTVDGVGLHPSLVGGRSRGFAAWRSVIDIRTERRATRTILAIYLESGAIWRLQAPYSGVALARDPDFEQKVDLIRQRWQDYQEVSNLTDRVGRTPDIPY
jgi:hypothetical protein